MSILSAKKKSEEISLTNGNNIITDKRFIVDELADRFYDQSATMEYTKNFQERKIKFERLPVRLKVTNSTLNYNKPFHLEELNKAISEAEINAAGIDEISYDFLRKIPTDTKITLLEEDNKIWSQGHISKDWKTGIIIHIPSAGHR